jgi:phosphoribosylanthranilate isomerase
MRLKVCGITEAAEVFLLTRLGIDLAGFWHGIDGGHADLPLEQFRCLVREATTAGRLEPVLVTFLNDLPALQDAVAESGVRWVQLHGFQPPALILALKKVLGASLRVIKVLHVHGQHCVEQALIGAYERAGADAFLFDAATADGRRIGSTGQRLDGDVVRALADRVTRPFFLAGGITAGGHTDHRRTVCHPRFLGVDVDTAARGEDGKICGLRVEALRRSWSASTEGGGQHAVQLH